MHRYIYTLVCLLGLCSPALAQYTTSNAHSHNDYEQAKPFTSAFARSFGSIEADVFERNGNLYVAHNQKDIDSSRTLQALYLQPLQNMVRAKKGIFATPPRQLQLLIDFKTAGEPTMRTLIQILSAFPEITAHPQIKIVISGSRPDTALWEQYPPYILFDGIPSANYTPAQLRRVWMISDNFRNYTQWNGKGAIAKEEKQAIQEVIRKVHAMGKKFRFWATPDNINTWKTMIKLGVDYLNTDKVDSLADYLEKHTGAQ